MRSCSMRLYALTFCLCAPAAFTQTAAPFPTGATTPLGQQLTAITNDPAVSRAHWGIAVTAIDGTPIYGMNEGQLFRPASNAKLFTTAAAMALLGPKRRWTTALEGPLASRGSSILQGDLHLIGAGDAMFASTIADLPRVSSGQPQGNDPFKDLRQLVDALWNEGVRRINGDIVGDDTQWPWEPYPEGWEADDFSWGYGAPVSALSFHDNQVKLVVHPSSSVGKPASARFEDAPTPYELDVQVETVAADQPTNIAATINQQTLRVYGTIALRGQPHIEEIAITDPARYAAFVLRDMLVERGIRVRGEARSLHQPITDARSKLAVESLPPLTLPEEAISSALSSLITGQETCFDACPVRVEHVSPTLEDDIEATLKVSQNMHAETMLRRLSDQYEGHGSTAQGARVVRQFLRNAGLDGDDFILYDGSGLSSHDLVTPRATAKLLAFATTQPWFAQWKSGLPVGGEDGTLSGRFAQPPLKDHIFAKTGTLGESRALSGYLDCASGKTVIFSIMVDNHTPTTHADRDALDNIIAAIAAAN